MGMVSFLLLTGALICNLLLTRRKPKPVRKGIPRDFDWSKVVH